MRFSLLRYLRRAAERLALTSSFMQTLGTSSGFLSYTNNPNLGTNRQSHQLINIIMLKAGEQLWLEEKRI